MDEADMLNDETFGNPGTADTNLPDFFQPDPRSTYDNGLDEDGEEDLEYQELETAKDDEWNEDTFAETVKIDTNNLPDFFSEGKPSGAGMPSSQQRPAMETTHIPLSRPDASPSAQLPSSAQGTHIPLHMLLPNASPHLRPYPHPTATAGVPLGIQYHPSVPPQMHHTQFQSFPLPFPQLHPSLPFPPMHPGFIPVNIPMPMPNWQPGVPIPGPRQWQPQLPPNPQQPHFMHPHPHNVPQQQRVRPPEPPPVPVPRIGQYMKERDVKFVLGQILKTLEMPDPYNDDFYYLQYLLNAHKHAVAEAVKHGRQPPNLPLLHMPLPALKDFKLRVQAQNAEMRAHVDLRTREWEAANQVLGHCSKSELSRPREIISLDREDLELEGGFASMLWQTRKAVERGYQALLTVQEISSLLTNPLVQYSDVRREELEADTKESVSLLGDAIGVATASDGRVILEGGLIAAILQTHKGQKLITRSFGLLPMEQRWALLPVVLARMLQRPPPPAEDMEGCACEERLMSTLLAFVNSPTHTHSRSETQSQTPAFLGPASATGEMNTEERTHLLSQLRGCLKSVMISHLGRHDLAHTHALTKSHNHSRARLLHAIIQLGDQLAAQGNGDDWVQLRQAFMDMLDTTQGPG